MPLQIAAQILGAPDPQVSVDALLAGTHWKPSQGWVIVGDTFLSWERLLAHLPLLPPHAHSIVGLSTTVCSQNPTSTKGISENQGRLKRQAALPEQLKTDLSGTL